MPNEQTDPALAVPRMTILSDHPILREHGDEGRREPDSFGLHSRLGAVYDIIRHKNTHAPLVLLEDEPVPGHWLDELDLESYGGRLPAHGRS